MSKDYSALLYISKYFTEVTLIKCIAEEKHVDLDSIELLSWSLEDLSGKADNYLSMVNKLRIKSKVNGTLSETRLIVKSLSKNIFKRKILRNAEYFYNEVKFYTKIATEFDKYLTDKGHKHLMQIPRCLDHYLDGENDYIVLQDVTCLGYSQITSENCLTYDECKSIVEALAKFHAISFAYKNEKKQKFEQMAHSVGETFYRLDIFEETFRHIYAVLFRIARQALFMEYPNSKGEEVFNSQDPTELYKKIVEICSKQDPLTSVICHGDAWEPNFMMRKNKSNKTDILLLDFQIARYASPVLDVVYFIYECTDKSVRDKYYDQLLKDYYVELSKTMKLLGSDPDKQYPWEIFQKEVKEQSVYGLMYALVNIPLSLLPKTDIFDENSIEEEMLDSEKLYMLSNLKKSEDRQRLADVIIHAVEHEFI